MRNAFYQVPSCQSCSLYQVGLAGGCDEEKWERLSVCFSLFLSLSLLETGFLCVALAVLELRGSDYLCLLNAGLKVCTTSQ